MIFIVGGHFSNDDSRNDRILITDMLTDKIAIAFFSAGNKLLFVFQFGHQLANIFKACKRIVTLNAVIVSNTVDEIGGNDRFDDILLTF